MKRLAQPVKLPAIFSGMASRKDRSYKLTFDTRELVGVDAAVLLGLMQTEGWLLFAPSEPVEADIPNEKPDPAVGTKTQSQRLRAVIYKIWQLRGSNGSFEDFYRSKMEAIIDQLKEVLNDE